VERCLYVFLLVTDLMDHLVTTRTSLCEPARRRCSVRMQRALQISPGASNQKLPSGFMWTLK